MQESPALSLRRLWGALQPAAARCAKRLSKGETASRAANEALREFRMLASVIDRLDATTTDDGDLDRLLEQLPDRLANVGRLEADGFIPPLAPTPGEASGHLVATEDGE